METDITPIILEPAHPSFTSRPYADETFHVEPDPNGIPAVVFIYSREGTPAGRNGADPPQRWDIVKVLSRRHQKAAEAYRDSTCIDSGTPGPTL